MRPFRHAGSLNVFAIFAASALAACSSSSNNNGTGGATGSGGKTGTGGVTSTGGKTGAGGVTGAGGATATGGVTGAGGSTNDASTDGPKDAPASTDTQVSDAAGFDYPSVDGPVSPANMTLTSTALAAGALFNDTNTCAGVNTSPPLTWTAGPSATLSYAVVLTDTNNAAAHWVIWDIPSTVLTLPAALPGDTTLTTPVTAQQLHKTAFFGAGGGYRGPCPGANGPHTYTFEVTAIPTATLTLGANPTTEQIRAEIEAVGIGHGDLSGTSSATMPPADAAGQ